METVVRNVKDLDAEERRACEELLGRALTDNQQLVIHVFTADFKPSAQDRDQALDRLRHLMEKAQRNVARSGLSDEEIGRIVDDAITAVRSGKA